MKNLNFTVLTTTVLIFATLTGSGILILNAEFLLAVCFITFVLYFYSNLSNNLVEPLEEQSNIIQKEFEQYYNKYESMLKTLVSYHERRVFLANELKQIASFSQQELAYLVDRRQKSFAQEISNQITQKLKTLELKDQEIYKDIQGQASSYFTDQVLTFFKKGGESTYSKDILVQEAINGIAQISNKKPNGYLVSDHLAKKLHNLLLINTITNAPLSFLIMQSACQE
jgi:Ca2+/Na+ antiporter